MIASIIATLLTSKLAQAIAGAVALFLAWLANGALQRRKGRLAERKEAVARDAKQANQQHKDRDNVESDIRPANAADELRANWRR